MAQAALFAGCTGRQGGGPPGAEPARSETQITARVPPSKPPRWVVTLGDSYISGEGARWAGNAKREWRRVDALGADAYIDGRFRTEQTPGCHRAEQSVADLHIVGTRGRNLACSGATTSSARSAMTFTPGVDTFADRRGHLGQVRQLRRFAQSHDVSTVVISIGGNDFGFGSVLTQCIGHFLLTVQSQPQPCSDDPAVTSHFAASRVGAVADALAVSLRRVSAAMKRAGDSAPEYRILVLTYPSPIPAANDLRYPETLHARFTVGGCPLFDADATWAATALRAINTAVRSGVRRSHLANVSLLDLSEALVGHRLCERGVSQLEDTDLASWRDSGAVDRLEWVNKLNLAPGRFAESVHPNYWGMLAQRACVRLALQQVDARSSRCLPVPDQHADAPRVTLR